jgi:hypothetical protein
MLQSTTDDGAMQERAPYSEPATAPGPLSGPLGGSRPGDSARAAVQAFARSGPYLGWGLLVWGVLWGSSRALGRIAEGPTTATIYAESVLDGLAIALASGLAGWASAVACRLAAEVINARNERASRTNALLQGLAPRAIEALHRLADVLERRPSAITPERPSDRDRVHLLAEIDQAVRSGRHAEAASLLDGFESRSPGDPAIPALRERLAAARREDVEGHVARIHAARQVNDADRVLELYRAVESSLEHDRRGSLGRELAKWFMELIYRRMRVGRIQVEVVQLATQVADTFGTTVEGASLRASLPMLRRSVGLCPRCAQPYAGTAGACPQCLTAAAGAPAPGGDRPDTPPDAEFDLPDAPPADGEGQDAGWLRYDEDDGDCRVPPA